MRILSPIILLSIALVLSLFVFDPLGFTWIDDTGPFGSGDQWFAHIVGVFIFAVLLIKALKKMRRGRQAHENYGSYWEDVDDIDPGGHDHSHASHDSFDSSDD